MNLGLCASCRNKNELHEGTDGRGYCEDCLAKNATLDPMSRHAGKTIEGGEREFTTQNDKRSEYLEFIITHVTDEWIDKYLDEWKDDKKRSYGWVQELRLVEDEMILLRMASELGFGKRAKFKESLNLDNIQVAVDTVKADSLDRSTNADALGRSIKEANANTVSSKGTAKSNTARNKAKTRS